MLILSDEDKPRSSDDFDKLVSAELPDKKTNPSLFETVSKCMMHGPCHILKIKHPCLNSEGICTKNFPKDFIAESTQNTDGFPLYRRRNDGRKTLCKGILLDNRSVVPYNPFLSSKYNAHINVEICNSVRAVKYLYKYVYKGHDRVVAQIKDGKKTNKNDEIENFVNARYVGCSESIFLKL